MKNNTFRRLLAMAAAGAMLTSIAACGSSSGDDTASNGSDSTSLISVNNSEPQNGLIPSDTNEMGGGKVIRYLFEGLVSFDAKGKQHLEVAESITPNEDATKYTIKLKEGWKFTNGEAVTRRRPQADSPPSRAMTSCRIRTSIRRPHFPVFPPRTTTRWSSS